MEEEFFDSVYYNYKCSNNYLAKKQHKHQSRKYKEICEMKLSNNSCVLLNLKKNKNWKVKNDLKSKIKADPEFGKEKLHKNEQVLTVFKYGCSEEENVFKFTSNLEKPKKDNIYFKKETYKYHVKKTCDKKFRKNIKTKSKRKLMILQEDFIINNIKKPVQNLNKNNRFIINLKNIITSASNDGNFVFKTFEDPVCSIEQLSFENLEENLNSFKKVFSKNECEICLNISDYKYVLNECQHGCCKECWTNYIRVNFPNSEFKCCFEKCNKVIRSDFLKILLSKDKYERFKKIYNAKKMEEKDFIECPKKCGNFFNINSKLKFPKCHCGHSICIGCKLNSHFPISCDQYLFYLINLAQTNGKNSFLVINGKFCPKCKAFIEKISGCPHMVCFCGYEFCWNCLQKYYPRNHYCIKKHDESSILFYQINEKFDRNSSKLYQFQVYAKNDLKVLLDSKKKIISKFLSSEFFKKSKLDIMNELNLLENPSQNLLEEILHFSFGMIDKASQIVELIFAGLVYNKIKKIRINHKCESARNKLINWLNIITRISKNNNNEEFFTKTIYIVAKMINLLNKLNRV